MSLNDTRALRDARQGRTIRLAGLVLTRWRPGTAKGVTFVIVENEHGEANVVVYANVGARDRRALIGARLLLVEGRAERLDEHAGVPILHLILRSLTDRSDLPDGLGKVDGAEAGWNRALGRADEVRSPEPGSLRPVKMPLSRDFRQVLIPAGHLPAQPPESSASNGVW